MKSPSVSSSQPTLTVAILSRDDAEGLQETLRSVGAFADEILVVEAGVGANGEGDLQRATATQYGAKLLTVAWRDDYSAARNHAMQEVTSDWVLWLDAGETLATRDARALRQSLATECDTNKAYMLVIQPPQAPGLIAAEQVARVRLLPWRASLRFRGRVRESLYESISGEGFTIEGLPLRITRGERENDLQFKRRRAERNQHLAQLEIDEVGRLPQLVNCLAEAAQILGDTLQAMELYQESLRIAPPATSERLEAYYGLLTCLDNVPRSRQVQLSLCVEALEHFPLDAQLLCAMGGYLQAEGRIDLAQRAYQTAYQFGRVNPLVWHLGEITAIAAICWSATLQQEEPAEAIKIIKEAIARDGVSARLARAAMDLHIQLCQGDEALRCIDHLGIDRETQTLLRSAIRGACLARAQNWAGARGYLQTAYDAGCRDVACLRWLATVQLALAQVDAARKVLSEWQRLYPRDAEAQRMLAALADAKTTSPGRPMRIDPPKPVTIMPIRTSLPLPERVEAL
jgi:tetratricopeptide (TPR) repeat protein